MEAVPAPFDAAHFAGDAWRGQPCLLESIARKYTSPYCDVIRAKIILLADDG
jgi:hypothetical protein